MAEIEPFVTETPVAGEGPIAIIDVGSNSVRLVVFELLTRSPRSVFDEKVPCGLGRGLGESGRLSPEGRVRALATIRRFGALIRAMRAQLLGAVATAAVRDAEDGEDFARVVHAEAGIALRVLSGTEEARITELGVLSAFPNAEGVMGDLGGGSLELVQLGSGARSNHETLALGPLRFLTDPAPSREEITAAIDSQIGAISWLHQAEGRTLYAVGGAWRTLARIHMAHHRYPLRIVHGYRISRQDMAEIAALVSRLGSQSVAEIEGVPGRRAESLPVAALVLERLLDHAKPAEVVMCAFGLREGLLYEHLPREARGEDPFLAAARDSASREGRYSVHAEEINAWARPVFEDGDSEHARLRFAACSLSDLSWRGHPDYRAELAMVRILRAPFVGLDHRERAFVSLAVAARYGGRVKSGLAVEAQNLMSGDAAREARAFGFALNLAHTLSGGMPNILSATRLESTGVGIDLVLPATLAAFAGEAVTVSLQALGESLGKKTRLVVE